MSSPPPFPEYPPPSPDAGVPDAGVPDAGVPFAAPPAPRETGAARRDTWVTRREVRAALLVVGGLMVVGVLVGLLWLWWSPARGIALALGPHTLLPDETEAFVAADGRYAALTGAVGLVAGLGCWFWRSVRGPVLPVALALGSGAGAVLTALVGRLFGGGVTGAATQRIVTPPLELRATGLLALEAAVALLVYGVSVAVSARDDLGRDDPRAARPDGTGAGAAGGDVGLTGDAVRGPRPPAGPAGEAPLA